MRKSSTRAVKARRAWFQNSVVFTIIAAVAMALGLLTGSPVLALAGGAAMACGSVASILHHRLGEGPFRSRAARARRIRSELATWTIAPSMAVAALAMANPQAMPRTASIIGLETTRVAGKPAEIRSETRRVIMPDGQSYYYWCGSETRPRRGCPALTRWKALPRWPEPKHIEMQAIGSSIYALTMDGKVIVDPETDHEDPLLKALLTFAALGLGGASVVAIRRRIRDLAGLKQPPKRRLHVTDGPSDPDLGEQA